MISNDKIEVSNEYQKNHYVESGGVNSIPARPYDNIAVSSHDLNQPCSHSCKYHGPLTTNQIIDATILHILLGWTGALHFYLGRHKWGLLYLCTFGLLGIGYVYDFFRLPFLFAEYNKSQHHSLNSNPTKPYELGEAYVFWLSFGWIGGHHFYLQNYERGLLYLCTVGGLGLLFVVDLFLMPSLVKEANLRINVTSSIDFHNRSCRYCHSAKESPASVITTQQQRGNQIDGGYDFSSTRTPILNQSNAVGATLHNGVDNTLIIKSTTVYTPSDQVYTTDAQATTITGEGISDIPYAYTITNPNGQPR